MTGYRCLNCKTIVLNQVEPMQCPTCKWGTEFAAVGVVERARCWEGDGLSYDGVGERG